MSFTLPFCGFPMKMAWVKGNTCYKFFAVFCIVLAKLLQLLLLLETFILQCPCCDTIIESNKILSKLWRRNYEKHFLRQKQEMFSRYTLLHSLFDFLNNLSCVIQIKYCREAKLEGANKYSQKLTLLLRFWHFRLFAITQKKRSEAKTGRESKVLIVFIN